MTVSETSLFIPQLSWAGENSASVDLHSGDEGVLSAVTLAALKQVASQAAGGSSASTVSVSLDMTGADFEGGAVSIVCKLDRQTRTLIFMNAMVTSGDTPLIKATAIFRLS